MGANEKKQAHIWDGFLSSQARAEATFTHHMGVGESVEAPNVCSTLHPRTSQASQVLTRLSLSLSLSALVPPPSHENRGYIKPLPQSTLAVFHVFILETDSPGSHTFSILSKERGTHAHVVS